MSERSSSWDVSASSTHVSLEPRVQPGQIGITHLPAFDIPQDAAQPLAVELALSCQVIEEVTRDDRRDGRAG